MSTNDLHRLQEIFEQALELDGPARRSFLDHICANDAELRGEIEALLAAHAEPQLDLPNMPHGQTTVAMPHGLPSRLGPFEILSQIGEGGMGIVYEARQETPRRIVALKVIRPGLASPEVLRRFHHESEVLGQLQHPGIAQVYAAGTVEGRPWFAMEHIRGVPLDAWVVRQTPDLQQRLVIMAAICDAVHHAHERGIVHRDLKPANVLVDSEGQPKILDFGVARVTNGDLAATMHTSTGQLVGTLAYMSPEQVGATGGAIDRRSDVYALGVMLYELLAGRLPYQIHGQPMVEALRIIRDEEPSRLSAVSHRFRGDLETIAAKALAKEPDRRYDTAAEMASDIRRYLNDEPIVARPPSTWYQVQKFARRNRGLVAGLAGVIIVLVLGAIVATTFAVRESRQRALFEREAYRSAIAAAAAEIRVNAGGRAAAALDATSPALRGWEWRYLRHVADRSLSTLHVDEDYSRLVLARDGRRVCGMAMSGAVHVLDFGSGGLVATIAGPFDPLRTRIAFSTDASRVYVSDAVNRRTRSFVIGDDSVDWELPFAAIGLLPFDRDGSIVFGGDGHAIAVDPITGRERRRWPIAGAASEIAYLADGQHVAYMSGSGLQVATLPSWTPLFSASVTTFVSRAGNRLIGELPGNIAELREPGGKLVVRSSVWITDVHPIDPDLGLSPVAEHGIGLVDVASGRPIVTLLGHASEISEGYFAADGRRFVTIGRDRTIRAWDAATPADPWITKGTGSFYAVSPDARFTAEAGWGYVRLWDAHTGWPLWTRILSRRGMNSVAFDAISTRIVAVADDGAVFVLDVAHGGEPRELTHLPGGALSVAWSRDGTEILAAGLEGIARILDAGDGHELRKLGSAEASAHVVLPMPDGSTIAAGGRGPDARVASWPTGVARAIGSGGVRLWDRATGRLLRTVDTSTATVSALAASGNRLAAGYDDGSIAVWSLDSSARSITTPATAAPITGLVFDPEGERLIVGRKGTVEILETDSLKSLASVAVSRLDMQSAAFTADGTLVTAGDKVAIAAFETRAATDQFARRALAQRLERRFNLLRRAQSDPDLPAEAMTSLDPSEGRELAAYARALGRNPNVLNSEALGVVRRTDATRADYELALRRIRAALPFRPDDLNFLKTLSLAQMRLGDYRSALATVERAETLLLAKSQSPRAADLAVRAIAQQALGDRARARESVERLRIVMRSPEEASEIESQALLVEAARAVEGSRARSE